MAEKILICKELNKIFEELTVIYNKLTKLIETDNDPYFVNIIAQLGKIKGEIIMYRMKR